MANVAFYGEVENGHIALPDSVKLPDKAKVYVMVSEVRAPLAKSPQPAQEGQAATTKRPKTMVYVPDLQPAKGPRPRRILSPRLANPADAARFKKTVVAIDNEDEDESL